MLRSVLLTFNISSSKKKTLKFVTTQSRRCLNDIPSPEFIPDEYITDFLSLLPVKFVLQFRCLIKWQDSLISSPTFVKLHLTRSARNAYLTLVSTSDDNVISFTVFRFLQNHPFFFNISEDPYYDLEDKTCLNIVGSCNGLFWLFGLSFIVNFDIWDMDSLF